MVDCTLPGEVDWKVCAHKSETTCLTFNREGDVLYTGGGDGTIKAWRTQDGRELGVMTGFKKSVTDVAASLDNEYIVASSIDQNKVTLFRTKTYRGLTNYIGHTDTVNACRFNFSQKSVVTCSNDRTIRYWDMLTGKNIRTDSCPQQVLNIDLSDTEALLLSTHMKDIRFWNTKTGGIVHTLTGSHHDAVTCARFTPDENLVVSTSKDHTVKVWDVRTWKLLYQPFEDSRYSCPSGIQNNKLCISPNS